MIIGERLRSLRETKSLSQGDIEQRSGLLRCYISRVENGHTVPSVETLEKMARALEVPLHQIFYDGEEPLKIPDFPAHKKGDEVPWGTSGKDARILRNLRRLLKRVSASDLKLLVFVAQKMAQQTAVRAKTQ
jgi:transcriptional regulator with XRE-family HTH domain